MFKRKALAATTAAALFGVGALLMAPGAYATPTADIAWDFQYPNSASNDTANCALCHTTNNPSPGGNADTNDYGDDIDLLAGYPLAFTQIEDLDSDGNGESNILEITCGSQPGWTVDSVPAPPSNVGLLDCGVPGPTIDVDPTTLDFGVVPLGEFVTAETTVTNLGNENTLSVTSLGFTPETPSVFTIGEQVPESFDLGPGESRPVGVKCTPDAAEASYTGTLLINSNDPDTPVAEVALLCESAAPGEECTPSVDPTRLEFGPVEIGDSLQLSTTVRNFGAVDCVNATAEVRPRRGEFTLLPEDPLTFSVPAGGEVDLTVEYAPVDVGEDQGNMELNFNNPGRTINVPLSGEGLDVVCQDCDIYRFYATRLIRLANIGRPVSLLLTVQNKGTVEGFADVTVVGVQNDAEVFRQELRMFDPAVGVIETVSLSYVPTEAGDIDWTATVVDADPDEDVATATTEVLP